MTWHSHVVTFGGARDQSPSSLVAEAESAGATVSMLGRGGRVAQIRQVRALVADRRPDLVHTTLFDADVVGRVGGRLARTPVVSSLVNVAYGPEQRANPALGRGRSRPSASSTGPPRSVFGASTRCRPTSPR